MVEILISSNASSMPKFVRKIGVQRTYRNHPLRKKFEDGESNLGILDVKVGKPSLYCS
jgi:hypothetical protein